jgi:hypothetical protein
MSEGRDLIVSESGGLRMPMRLVNVLQGLPRLLVPSQVILLSMLLANTIGVRAGVVQLGGSLMVLVMRSVVISSRHIQILTIRPDLVWASFASLYAWSE